MSLQARAIAAVLLALALIAGWWRLTAHYERIGYDRRKAEDEAAAELQREANRGRAVQAETKQAAQAQIRERYIVTTVKELVHETDNLAACVLTPAARQRLHDAAACASQDRSAACGTGDSVQPSE
jgi:hypothetical protein